MIVVYYVSERTQKIVVDFKGLESVRIVFSLTTLLAAIPHPKHLIHLIGLEEFHKFRLSSASHGETPQQ